MTLDHPPPVSTTSYRVLRTLSWEEVFLTKPEFTDVFLTTDSVGRKGMIDTSQAGGVTLDPTDGT